MTYEDKRDWRIKQLEEGVQLDNYNLPVNQAHLLALSGIAPADMNQFLEPSFDQIPPIKNMYGLEEASKKIINAIKNDKKIFIHGDFDADGICATTILWEYLYRDLVDQLDSKSEILPFIPDRIEQGYGLSESSVSALVEKDVDLIVTVDCGIRDRELIEKTIADSELDIIVTDHHQAPDDVWDAEYTIVHPSKPGEEFSGLNISGSLVSLILTLGIRKELGEESEISEKTAGLDLAAIATVTDMMPLRGVNRVVVSKGLEIMRENKRLGLAHLMQISKIEPKDLRSYHFGFVIGPRINAAGRIGDPIDAVRLLATKDPDQAKELAFKLDQVNRSRQQMTDQIMEEVLKKLNYDDLILSAVGDNWSEGIIGLVAGKIMERFKKPTIIMSRTDNEIRGSARSLNGFDITEALENSSEYLKKFGGHSDAAGFTLDAKDQEKFLFSIEDYASTKIDPEYTEDYMIDIELSVDDIDMPMLNFLDKMEPFGEDNRKPLFAIRDGLITGKKIMGSDSNHMRLMIKSGLKSIPAVVFNCSEDIEKIFEGDTISVAGYPNLNEWNGNTTIQFMIRKWKKDS